MIFAALGSAIVFVICFAWFLRSPASRRTKWQRLVLALSACGVVGFTSVHYFSVAGTADEVIEYPSETVTFGDQGATQPAPNP